MFNADFRHYLSFSLQPPEAIAAIVVVQDTGRPASHHVARRAVTIWKSEGEGDAIEVQYDPQVQKALEAVLNPAA